MKVKDRLTGCVLESNQQIVTDVWKADKARYIPAKKDRKEEVYTAEEKEVE